MDEDQVVLPGDQTKLQKLLEEIDELCDEVPGQLVSSCLKIVSQQFPAFK